MSHTFHSSIYSQSIGTFPKGARNFKPFKTAEEMTAFTGMSVEAWNERASKLAALRKRKFSRKAEPSNHVNININIEEYV